ncbi:MAG: hypothetical protein ACJ77K_04875 [Bacteroidia bacterium]
MKNTVFAMIAVAAVCTASAQKDVKYAKLYYKNTVLETNEVTLSVDNAVSTDQVTKFKLKVTNKTNDFIMFKPEECKFIIGGKEMKPHEKAKIISPNDFNTFTFDLSGAGYNSVKNYTFEVGGLYRVSTSGKVTEMADFRLPVSTNDVKAGNFACSMTKLTKESGKCEAKFDCSYTGDKIAIVDPSKMAVKMPDGNEYASVKPTGLLAKTGPIIMMKGDKESIAGNWDRMTGGKAMDMQKVEMMIKWHETFTEATPEKLKNETLNLEFDEATSNEKGK